jgi:hypothetical protein
MVRGVKKTLKMDIQPEGTEWVARALAGDPYLTIVEGSNSSSAVSSAANIAANDSSRVKLDINEVLWDIVNGRDAKGRVPKAALAAAAAAPVAAAVSSSVEACRNNTPAVAASPAQQDVTAGCSSRSSSSSSSRSFSAAEKHLRINCRRAAVWVSAAATGARRR